MHFLAVFMSLAILFTPASSNGGAVLTGTPRVIDGDTIHIGAAKIRLYGIDAPEYHQTCDDSAGETYRCGKASTSALKQFIGRSAITCFAHIIDKYKRHLAVCFHGTTNINKWMVQQGLALAYRQYAPDYISDEDKAQSPWKSKSLHNCEK